MRVLGQNLPQPFNDFWDELGAEIPVAVELIEEGHSAAFGDQGVDITMPDMPAWASLPDDDLAYHVAHELTHLVLTQRGFPKTGRGQQYPEDSAEARIGGDLDEMVNHASLKHLLEPFAFKNDVIQKRIVDGTLQGLASSPVPEHGTPWSFTWAIRYCDLQLELPAHHWIPIEILYRTRCPDIAELGAELASIMRDVGWSTREQALEAMIRVRDTLGMKVDERILVIDPVTGKIF